MVDIRSVKVPKKLGLIICAVGLMIVGISIVLPILSSRYFVIFREDLDPVRLLGMSILLVGFLFLLVHFWSTRNLKAETLFCAEHDGRLWISPIERSQVMLISDTDLPEQALTKYSTDKRNAFRAVIASRCKLTRPFFEGLQSLPNLFVVDMQSAEVEEQHLELLEECKNLEILLVAGMLAPKQLQNLRMALPGIRIEENSTRLGFIDRVVHIDELPRIISDSLDESVVSNVQG